jgi:TolB-like protein/Flp pilus assembly protein TadD
LDKLFDELKRRNVIRVAVAYLIASWLVMQVADIVLEAILAPAWVMQVFLLIVSLGLPCVLIISWAYELTPEGLKREADVDRSQSITPHTGRKLNLITIGLLVGVLLVVGVDRTLLPQRGVEGPVDGSAEVLIDKSIAVLAFEDLSAEGDQAYFAEGLSEELLNVLAKVPDLKVAGRTSSFAFRGKDKDLREIGELLNVAHLLEGSIRKSGNRIRVTAQLIKVSDGFHLFSETYDRELSDIFALQDEIAASIATAMLSEIIGTESVATVARTDNETYELYLLARQRIHSRDPAEMSEATVMLDRALEIDPIYAPALTQKALVNYLMSDTLGSYGEIPFAEVMPVSMKLVEQALALDDSLAEAHAVKGLLLTTITRHEEAIDELTLSLELNPTMSDAATWLSSALASNNQWTEARLPLEEVVERDPTFGPAFNNLVLDYVRTSETDQADALIDRVSRIVGENDDIRSAKATIAVMDGRAAEAIRELRIAYEANPNASVVQAWYGFALLAIADYETIIDVGLPEHRILAYHAIGDLDAAHRTLETFDIAGSFPPRVLKDIGLFFNSNNASQAFIDYILKEYGTLETLLRTQSIDQDWGNGYAAQLAYAYLQIGEEEIFAELLELIETHLESAAKNRTDNSVVRYSEAEYAALNGDIEGAINALQRAIDSGFRNGAGIESPVFGNLHSEPKFKELQQSMASYVDEERAKLGMEPYLPYIPVSALDESKKKPAWQP